MYPKLKKFLSAQAQRMHALDEQEGLHKLANIRPEVDEAGQPTGRHGFDVLYENMANYVLREKLLQWERANLENVLTEDTVSTAIASFTTFALPLVRRVMRQLVVVNSGLVSVQPMRTPTSEIFWLKRLYSSAHSADGISQYDDVDAVPGAVSYAQSSEKGTIRELQLKLDHKIVTAISMKLQTGWTLEAAQNLLAYHQLDYESEMKSLFTDEVQVETDNYIVAKLLAGSSYNVNWCSVPPIGDVSTADKKAYWETLFNTAIMNASMHILKYMHVPAGWAILGPDVLAYLLRSQTFAFTAPIQDMKTQMGLAQVGTLNGMIRVFVSPSFPANKILLGCDAVDWARSVAVYAPFLPIFFSPTYVTGNDFSQMKSGAASRFWAGVIGTDENATTSPGLATVTITAS